MAEIDAAIEERGGWPLTGSEVNTPAQAQVNG
jgi:hypothetical protein